MLTTNQKGAIAETAIAHEAIKLGVGVSRPLADLRYDLVFDTGKELLRVQCKWAPRSRDVVVVRLYGARRSREGILRTYYGTDEVDAFALYCPDTDRCYFLSVSEVATRYQVLLRLDHTRNNQMSGVNWAKDHEFAAKLGAGLGP